MYGFGENLAIYMSWLRADEGLMGSKRVSSRGSGRGE